MYERVASLARRAGFTGSIRVHMGAEPSPPFGVSGYFNPHVEGGEIMLFVPLGVHEDDVLITLAHEVGHSRRGLDETAADLESLRVLGPVLRGPAPGRAPVGWVDRRPVLPDSSVAGGGSCRGPGGRQAQRPCPR